VTARKSNSRGSVGGSELAELRKRLGDAELRNSELERLYEEALRSRSALTQAMVEQIPNAFFVKDCSGRFTLVNRAWSEMSGFPAERAIGRTVHDLYPPQAANRFAAEDEALLARGAAAPPIEAVHEGPRDGQFRLVRKAVLSDGDGRVQGLVCTSTDISELKRIESELANQVKFTKDFFDSVPLALAMRNAEGKYLLVNRTWKEYFGASDEEVVGETLHQRLTKEEADEVLALDRAALGRGPGAPLGLSEFSHRGRHYLQTRTVMADSQGNVRGVLIASLDTTEKHRIEAELADRAKFVSELIDALPVSIALRDTEGRFLQVNRTWERYFNIRREDALGRRISELPGWKDNAELAAVAKDAEQIDRDVIARGPGAEPLQIERARLGRTYLNSRQVFVDTAGRTVGVLGTGLDTTERREMEEALKRAERDAADRAKIFDELIDALPVSIALRDTAGRFLKVNRTWERYFNIRREDALGKLFSELPGWRDGEPLDANAKRSAQYDRDAIARGPDAEPTQVEGNRLGRAYITSRQVFADSAGRLTAVLATGRDITESKAMEEALVAERQQLALVVSATKAGIIDWDTSTETPWYSARFKEMLGYPADADTSAWASIFGSLMHPDDRDRSREVFFSGLVSKGDPNSVVVQEPLELRLRRADGGWLWVQSMGLTLRDEAGEVKRYLAAVTDISERREQEQALRDSVRLREEVERMSRHDLKTPLNSVIAMSRLLREGGRVAQEDAELLGTIERAGYRILNMVNLSLDLFRMETGTYHFHPQAVDLAGVACRVAADLESQAASKNLDVRVRANGVSAATQEMLVRGDELLCYSMFANLVKNAIEASPPWGAVSISLKNENGSVIAEVHNPGAVPDAMRGRFFRKYATTGKSAGLGLGAYSAQLMARVQEGELSLESSEEKGTTLVARFKPAEADLPRTVESLAAAGASGAAGASLPPRKVLVVDDDEFNRLVLRRFLPAPPLSVAFAVNGLAALESATREWPDVVLLDLEMPVMDGYEAARRLRQMELSKGLKRCMIVAISSNDEEAVMQRALAAGCDEYIVKPAPRQVLWRILGGSAAGDRAGGGTGAAASASDAVTIDADLGAALPEFLRSRRKLLDEMLGALAADDRPLFRRLAHRLAGSFALFGFAWAAAHCRAIEGDALAADPRDLEARTAAVLAHLGNVTIEYAPEKRKVGD
jgi:PAS domain S-box-containing protein